MASFRSPHVLVSAISLALLGTATALAGPTATRRAAKVRRDLPVSSAQKLLHRGSIWVPCYEMTPLLGWPADYLRVKRHMCSALDRDKWVELAGTVNFPVTDEDEAYVASSTCMFKSPHGLKYDLSFVGNWKTTTTTGRVEHQDTQVIDITPTKTKLVPSKSKYELRVKFRMDAKPSQPLGEEWFIGCRVDYLIKNPWIR